MSKIAVVFIVACAFQGFQAQLLRPRLFPETASFAAKFPNVPELNLNLPINPEQIIDQVKENVQDRLPNVPELSLNLPINPEQIIGQVKENVQDRLPNVPELPQIDAFPVIPEQIVNIPELVTAIPEYMPNIPIPEYISNIPELDINFPSFLELTTNNPIVDFNTPSFPGHFIGNIQGVNSDYFSQLQLPQGPSAIISQLSQIQQQIETLEFLAPGLRTSVTECIQEEQDTVQDLVDLLKVDIDQLIADVQNIAGDVGDEAEAITQETDAIREIVAKVAGELPSAVQEGNLEKVIQILEVAINDIKPHIEAIQVVLSGLPEDLADEVNDILQEANQLEADAQNGAQGIIEEVIRCILSNGGSTFI